MPVKVLGYSPISVGFFYTILAGFGAIVQIAFFFAVTSKANSNVVSVALVESLISIPVQFIVGYLVAYYYNVCARNKFGDKLTLELSDNPRSNESILVNSFVHS